MHPCPEPTGPRRCAVTWLLAGLLGCGGGDDGGGEDEGADGSGSDGKATASASASASGSASASTSASGSGSDSGTGGTSDGSGTTGADCDCDAGASVPVCGVDGMDYDAACGIECVPVVISCMQACPCPPVQCGIPCDPEDRVCTTTIGGVKNAPPSFSCDPVPPSCDGMTPTCDCVATGCDCTEAPPGYFQVTCNAP